MRERKARLLIPLVLSTAVCANAQAQGNVPDTQFTIGMKAWHASWLSYIPATYTGVSAGGTPAIGDSVNESEGQSHTDFMPLISVRHKNFFVSLSHARFSSHFPVSTSPIVTPAGQTLITSRNDHFTRRESDLNVGYSITPEVAIAIGYKEAVENRDTSLGISPQAVPVVKTTARGLLLGAIGSFAVYDKLRFYTQAAYGPARLKLVFADPAFGTNFKTTGRYLIGEIGLSYPVFANPSGFGGAILSLGYRTQTVKTDSNVGLFRDARKLRDIRDGAILSLNYTF
jgi:hypothetical protein